MKLRTTHILAGLAAIATFGGTAQAQMTSGAQQPQAQPAAPSDAGPVSDAEVTKFATVVMGIQKMQTAQPDLQPAEQQQAVMALLKENDLDPTRFQQIAMSSRTDTDLRDRIAKRVGEMAQAG